MMPQQLLNTMTTAPALGLHRDTIRYFDSASGRAYSFDIAQNRATPLGERGVAGFSDGTWIPDTQQAIVRSTKNGAVQYGTVDYATGAVHQLPQSITALAAAPDGSHIVFAVTDGDASRIVMAKPDGSESRTLLETRAQNIALSWPVGDTLIMISQHVGRPGKDMTAIHQDGSLSLLLENRDGLAVTWSHSGAQGLISWFAADQRIALAYYVRVSGTEIPLPLATDATKCAWQMDDHHIVCGVPGTSQLVSGISADRTATVDAIISLDTLSDSQQALYTPHSGAHIGIIDPVISSSGRSFIFTNLFDHTLYTLDMR